MGDIGVQATEAILERLREQARFAHSLSCSPAAARKVSAAAINTRLPCPFSFPASLPTVVVLPNRRGTMEKADRLYGITMQEKGVSTLVSVNLIDKELDD